MTEFWKDEERFILLFCSVIMAAVAVFGVANEYHYPVTMALLGGVPAACFATGLLPEPHRTLVYRVWTALGSIGLIALAVSVTADEHGLRRIADGLYALAIFAPLNALFAAYAAGLPSARQYLWAYRGCCVAALAFCGDDFDHSTARYFLLAAVAAVAVDIIARRLIDGPGFFIDERGERQRIKGRNRGLFIYDPKTYTQRVAEEHHAKRKRHAALAGSTPFLIFAAIGMDWTGRQPFPGPGFAFLIGIAALYPGYTFALNLAKELIYQTGYQGMTGAKVLDAPPPAQPGIQTVAAQKAHGDARLASDARAQHLMNTAP